MEVDRTLIQYGRQKILQFLPLAVSQDDGSHEEQTGNVRNWNIRQACKKLIYQAGNARKKREER